MKSAEEWARECVEGEPYWEAVGETAQEERIAKLIREARNDALEAAAELLGRGYAMKPLAVAIRELKDEP